MSVLECKGITKRYKDKEVLKGVDLKIEQGKIYGLIGRNGAGKTTLLSILTAQSPANSGEVRVDGEPVWENRNALDKLCFSREINSMSILGPNNLKIKEYFRIAKTFYPNWDEELAEKLITDFGIKPKSKIHKLSKGMLSMVTIAIGMASKAPITILDEPVAGLDVVAREDFYRMVIEENAETGRTFIISTHIIEEAADVFEEVMFLKDGVIFLKENTQDILERSKHITGLSEEVDKACENLNVYHEENMGRSKGVTVILNDGENIKEGCDVTIQPVSLQQLFVAVCGREEV
ncbi:MAG: ABC transporter ATP-binding protein [Eubacterium sp.]|nr:ABC transporter ATP-binding protein [Eubacterium sp.]